VGHLITPDSLEDLLELVKWANSDFKTLETQGQGTKRALGRKVETDYLINLSKFSGIEEYQPNELVITAKSSTPLTKITTELTKNGQYLSFEPPDFGPLLGAPRGKGTIGGVISCNLAGSRRIKTGSVRDHFLGFKAISGRGENFKSGGKVVKNVTGFDLSKLIAGSYGTLGIMTEVTLKTLPSPKKTRTILIRWPKRGFFDQEGIHSMRIALNSSHEVSGAAFVQAGASAHSKIDYVRESHKDITAIRVEGTIASVEHRCRAIKDLLKNFGSLEELHSKNSAMLWSEISNVTLLLDTKNQNIWRISTTPSEGAKIVLAIIKKYKAQAIYDWGGGLIWLAIKNNDGGSTKMIRDAIKKTGGHATLFYASQKIDRKSAVFQPQESTLKKLTERIKNSFDPNHILNPGRMYEGF